MPKRVYLAADHAGYELKEDIKQLLVGKGYDVTDKGAHQFNAGDDYPDFIRLAAMGVVGEAGSVGIVFGGSGQGEAIVANRIPGIRAIVYYGGQKEIITLSRQHNDANILSIGARFVSADDARQAVLVWLETKFSGDERHARRIKKIDGN
jgi:ribose 5-phosphate isomerase B